MKSLVLVVPRAIGSSAAIYAVEAPLPCTPTGASQSAFIQPRQAHSPSSIWYNAQFRCQQFSGRAASRHPISPRLSPHPPLPDSTFVHSHALQSAPASTASPPLSSLPSPARVTISLFLHALCFPTWPGSLGRTAAPVSRMGGRGGMGSFQFSRFLTGP